MTRFNTGNPIGSADPRDRDDNSKNLDEAVNDLNAETWVDRFGVERLTIQGALNRFNDVIIAGGQIFESEESGRDAVQDGQYYYSVSDEPDVSKALWRRISPTESERIADEPSVEFTAGLANKISQISRSSPGIFYTRERRASDTSYSISDASGALIASWMADGYPKTRYRHAFYRSEQDPVWLLVDDSYRLITSVDSDGSFSQVDAPQGGAESLLPYPYLGTIRASGDSDYHMTDLGQYSALSMYPYNEKSIRAVIDRPLIGQTQTVRVGIDSNLMIPDDKKTLHIIAGLGQSLMVGVGASDSMVSTVPVYPNNSFMFDLASGTPDVRMGIGSNTELNANNLTGFVPLAARAVGARGQTPLESMADELVKTALSYDAPCAYLSFTAGASGTRYSGLKKGTTTYDNLLRALSRARELADAVGMSVVLSACAIKHGEGDNTNANYFDDLLEWQRDVTADAQSILGQSTDVHFIIQQHSSYTTETPRSAEAMARAHVESPHHSVSGADYSYYDLYSSDELHFTGPGYYIIGEYLAKGFKEVVFGAHGKADSVYMLSATRTGANVDVSFNVPSPPLVIDPSLFPEKEDEGFVYRVDGQDVQIENVTVVNQGMGGEGVVRLTLANEPNGDAEEEVRYALSPKVRDQVTDEILERVGGNIRDSAQLTSSYDGRPLYNWGIQQSMGVVK